MITVSESAEPSTFAALRRAWTEEDDGRLVDDPDYEAAFSRWWSSEHDRRRTWLARVDERPVGMLNLIVIDRMPRPGRPNTRWGYLSHLYVLPGYRGAGVGGMLLAACVARSRDDVV